MLSGFTPPSADIPGLVKVYKDLHASPELSHLRRADAAADLVSRATAGSVC